MAHLNHAEFRDRVLGCWMGKNIGGTLGAPFEGTREMPEVSFYTEKLDGNPLPNDDLDLQLIWLFAAEELGVYHITPGKLAEYWLNFECAPMGEYRNCIANIVNGFLPPLSGSWNNDQWKWSNGAWIRSEIWACIFPGSPDEAARCACIDACCDHEGEGIWAEVFTAALESAAFVEKDTEKLIDIALGRIAPGCRIYNSVRKALDLFKAGVSLEEARQQIVELNQDTGFFQAPQNIGFLVLAILYGEGDFEKTVITAVRCGDDTDCTAATAGAVLGIMLGRSRIPEKWCRPIGSRIVTKCLAQYGISVPQTLEELTDRSVAEAIRARAANPALLAVSDAPTDLSGFEIAVTSPIAGFIAARSPYEVQLETPFCRIGADLEGGPEIEPGVAKHIHLTLRDVSRIMATVKVELMLPEDWTAPRGCCFILPGTCLGPQCGEIGVEIIPGEISDAIIYLPVKITISDRMMPEIRMLPLQRKGTVSNRLTEHNGCEYVRRARRLNARIFAQRELSF